MMEHQADGNTQCALCERWVKRVSRHHLQPKSKGGRYGETVPLCQPCHSSIHHFISNAELARHYATVQELRTAPPLQKYLRWIKKRAVEKISNRAKK